MKEFKFLFAYGVYHVRSKKAYSCIGGSNLTALYSVFVKIREELTLEKLRAPQKVNIWELLDI
ncbi:hypothetical protein LCGC14_1269650 [marine sediment metagenome]|uniref:Uncharacterized protein n=1 Tax=marine sediment metagenome TaxID=412755 RepID=A0A0F9NF99_9ZZZZ